MARLSCRRCASGRVALTGTCYGVVTAHASTDRFDVAAADMFAETQTSPSTTIYADLCCESCLIFRVTVTSVGQWDAIVGACIVVTGGQTSRLSTVAHESCRRRRCLVIRQTTSPSFPARAIGDARILLISIHGRVASRQIRSCSESSIHDGDLLFVELDWFLSENGNKESW